MSTETEQAPQETTRPARKRKARLMNMEGFCDTEQLSARLGVCRKTLFSYRDSGKLPYVQLGRKVIYHWPSVEAALLRQQRGTA